MDARHGVEPGRRGAWWTRGLLTVLALLVGPVGTFLAGPVGTGVRPAYAAEPQVPALPSTVRDRCLGGSPVVARTASWGSQRLGPAAVWPLSRGDGVLVAVLDSGVSAAVPALAGAVLPGTDAVSGDGPADRDCRGRGTLLASLVVARPRSGSAVTGLAPAARILPVRVVSDDGKVPGGVVAQGVRAAVDAGASVLLVTAGPTADTADLRDAIAVAAARDVVVVASVGTGSGSESGPVWYPAAYPGVLAVGGVDAVGVPVQQIAVGQRVDLVAPGTDVTGSAPAGSGHYRAGGSAPAAAQVAGVVALVRARYPHLTAPEVRRRLLDTARRPPGVPGQSALIGAGMVDGYAAVAALSTAPQAGAGPNATLLRLPTASGRSVRAQWAAAIGGGVLLLTCLGAGGVLTVRHGRRRRWRSR
ncbi:S8 family serine peptidase [Micromonospora sp. Llam7]|uniref:S8 family serine peptidase n=1 Tax=Micromonospora tarapacensis TaxID=2835305 RepID=UPI001C83BCC4|nr:S8 family serine peptidase [Micromonospora tarapacensis]MBX7266391.1 S8 family serine peptidase [Micromonospora tarapacensis]